MSLCFNDRLKDRNLRPTCHPPTQGVTNREPAARVHQRHVVVHRHRQRLVTNAARLRPDKPIPVGQAAHLLHQRTRFGRGLVADVPQEVPESRFPRRRGRG